jgi:hypothetical protein
MVKFGIAFLAMLGVWVLGFLLFMGLCIVSLEKKVFTTLCTVERRPVLRDETTTLHPRQFCEVGAMIFVSLARGGPGREGPVTALNCCRMSEGRPATLTLLASWKQSPCS